jgi:hypothetical protein
VLTVRVDVNDRDLFSLRIFNLGVPESERRLLTNRDPGGLRLYGWQLLTERYVLGEGEVEHRRDDGAGVLIGKALSAARPLIPVEL